MRFSKEFGFSKKRKVKINVPSYLQGVFRAGDPFS
jgi:hypothetical protein